MARSNKLYRVNICLKLRYTDSPFRAHSFVLRYILVGIVGVLANVSDMSGSDSNDALRDLVPDILGIHDDDEEFLMAIDDRNDAKCGRDEQRSS
jgi:hypothetical protein